MAFSLSGRGAVAALVLGLAGLLPAAPAATAAAGADCADGVTVVVDFTDVDGEVEVGCAAGDPTSGREALELAGFTPTDSVPGMICAIDSRPDPCPEEFDGSFWSYWTGGDGEWTAHVEGADSIDPAPGDVEGWRYNDGSTGPGTAPDEAAATVTGETAAEETGVDPADADATDTETDAETADSGGVPTWVWIGAAGVVVLAVAVGLLLRNNRRR